MSARTTTRSWLMQRAPLWQQLGASLPRLQRGRCSPDDALQALDGYRGLARDLATARAALPGSSVTSALEALYASFHALVNRPVRNTPARLLRMLREEIPQTMRELRPALLWIVLLFVVSTGAGWLLIERHPTLITLIASEEMIERVEGGELWTEGLLNVTPASMLSLRIFTNNIVVSLFAFCVGLFYGLGTFYLIANNGLMLGALLAFTRQHGLDDRLLNFIVAHGLVELSIICVAGAAGTALGESLIRPRHGSRRESLQHCVAQMGPLLALCALLLIGCGVIEGYVSPDPSYPMWSRTVVGVGWFIVMVAALSGRLWGRSAAQTAAHTRRRDLNLP